MAGSAAEPATPAKAKKGGGIKKMLIFGVGAVVLLGGGAAGGMFLAGSGPMAGGKEAHEDPNKPKLVPREGSASASDGHGGAAPSKYQASYYEIEKTFTSNLSDADGFMQVSIGVSTPYDQRVIENLKTNELPVRSAILMTLSNQEAYVVSTPQGKKALQKQLKDAINKALEEKTGFGGVDDVYFTSFVIQ